jgi:hypothetical protein
MFYVLGIWEGYAIDFLESVCPGSDYLSYHVRSLLGRGQLVLTLLGLCLP